MMLATVSRRRYGASVSEDDDDDGSVLMIPDAARVL